jgi:hypothetical protein
MSKRKRIAALEREVAELRERIARLEARPAIVEWPVAPMPQPHEPFHPWGEPVITYTEKSTAGPLPETPLVLCAQGDDGAMNSLYHKSGAHSQSIS